ncbi:galactokinase [Flagellimonas crocea]|uniref:galactokinase n=1 Tax=Flagellimonas crocea TaxID=3067311 RepID=UPI00296F2E69|nr:galactokinase [Muricauda sp. DH64]
MEHISRTDKFKDIQKTKDNYDILVTAPGRINLIGEHTDYNGGLVLPGAVNKTIKLYLRKNNTLQSNFYSKNIEEGFSCEMDYFIPQKTMWRNFVLGVLDQILRNRRKPLPGFDCYIESDLPAGSGLSSSAALECGLATGVNALFELGYSDWEIIKLSQRAEHEFVGTKCGIMDQFAVVKGERDKLIYLNCETLESQMIPVDFGPYSLVLLNTNVSHQLADSEYNKRTNQCREALGILNQKKSSYPTLASIPKARLLRFKNKMDPELFGIAKYVIEENHRVKSTVKKLRKSRLKDVGKLIYESHEGLQHLFRVSCTELDFLVDFTRELDYVIGSRMMGGGFGGCTLSLVKTSELELFLDTISSAYRKEFDLDLTPLVVSIHPGIQTKTKQ